MPWNEPGNNGKNDQNNPWGGRRNQNPPDLDKMISDFIKKMNLFFNKKFSPPSFRQSRSSYKGGISIICLVLFILWFFSGIFIVNPAEEAVILRFGKYVDVLQPGLHWMARFIDTKYLVDIQKIYSFSLENDFLTKSSEQSDLGNRILIDDNAKKSVISLDQSKNLVNVELNVQYKVSDPRAYLFNVVDPDDTMRQVAAGALSEVVGGMKLDEVLTTGREVVSSGVFDAVKRRLAIYHVGLDVVAVTLKKVQAPDQVREAFSDVNRADQDKATTIQQAQAYASKVVPLAQGEAARILADSNGYRQQIALIAQANIAGYEAMLQAYQASPDITRERLYLDTMQIILQNSSKVLINTTNNNLIYLPLNKLMERAPAAIRLDPQEALSHEESITSASLSANAGAEK